MGRKATTYIRVQRYLLAQGHSLAVVARTIRAEHTTISQAITAHRPVGQTVRALAVGRGA